LLSLRVLEATGDSEEEPGDHTGDDRTDPEFDALDPVLRRFLEAVGAVFEEAGVQQERPDTDKEEGEDTPGR